MPLLLYACTAVCLNLSTQTVVNHSYNVCARNQTGAAFSGFQGCQNGSTVDAKLELFSSRRPRSECKSLKQTCKTDGEITAAASPKKTM